MFASVSAGELRDSRVSVRIDSGPIEVLGRGHGPRSGAAGPMSEAEPTPEPAAQRPLG